MLDAIMSAIFGLLCPICLALINTQTGNPVIYARIIGQLSAPVAFTSAVAALIYSKSAENKFIIRMISLFGLATSFAGGLCCM